MSGGEWNWEMKASRSAFLNEKNLKTLMTHQSSDLSTIPPKDLPLEIRGTYKLNVIEKISLLFGFSFLIWKIIKLDYMMSKVPYSPNFRLILREKQQVNGKAEFSFLEAGWSHTKERPKWLQLQVKQGKDGEKKEVWRKLLVKVGCVRVSQSH